MIREFASFLMITAVVLGRLKTPPTSVMICRGAFSVRQSVCDSVAANVLDLVPSETFQCTALGAPSLAADFFTGQSIPAWSATPVDFTSSVTIRNSLAHLTCGLNMDVFFADCETATSLPRLDDQTDYLALIVLDEAAIKSSQTMTGSSQVNIYTTVMYIDLSALTDPGFANSLAAGFDACQNGNAVCQVQYSTSIVSKSGYLSFDANQ